MMIAVFPFDFTRGKILSKIVRYWARAIFLSSGIKTKIIGLENLDSSKNYIFAANHSSSLDIPLMLGFIPFWIVPISKIELKWIPFLGWAMQMAGHVFVDRSKHENAMLSIKNIKNDIQKNYLGRATFVYKNLDEVEGSIVVCKNQTCSEKLKNLEEINDYIEIKL